MPIPPSTLEHSSTRSANSTSDAGTLAHYTVTVHNDANEQRPEQEPVTLDKKCVLYCATALATLIFASSTGAAFVGKSHNNPWWNYPIGAVILLCSFMVATNDIRSAIPVLAMMFFGTAWLCGAAIQQHAPTMTIDQHEIPTRYLLVALTGASVLTAGLLAAHSYFCARTNLLTSEQVALLNDDTAASTTSARSTDSLDSLVTPRSRIDDETASNASTNTEPARIKLSTPR